MNPLVFNKAEYRVSGKNCTEKIFLMLLPALRSLLLPCNILLLVKALHNWRCLCKQMYSHERTEHYLTQESSRTLCKIHHLNILSAVNWFALSTLHSAISI